MSYFQIFQSSLTGDDKKQIRQNFKARIINYKE